MGTLKIFFDGGCRPNPGEMETAVVARGVAYRRAGLGLGDNHEAEWLALIDALRVGRLLGAADVTLIGDSQAVIDQARRRPAGGRALRHLPDYEALAAGFARIRLRHVARAQNLAGIVLERAHGRL